MSTTESKREKLAGLSLDDILANQQRHGSTPPSSTTPRQPPPKSRTLIDIIKDDESNKKDRRSWKAFKDKLRLKRAGSAWTSSIPIPTSDIPIQNPNSRSFSQFGRRNSVRVQTHYDSDMSTHQVDELDPSDESNAPASRPKFTRGSSTRFTADSSENSGGGNLRPQLSRKNSTNVSSADPFRKGRVVTFRDSFDDEEPDDDTKHPETGRALSAREAVAAQEAAEAAAEAEAEAEAATGPPTMSLMDLLGETDREMGLEGSRYILSDEEDFSDDDYEEGEDDEDGESALEHTCSICMVKHKGTALAACGHSFCRMCSRELLVSKGNCPLCNNFVLEILEIF
ncbi:E3 ubiquitin-protein ligase bre1 [Medicago truncatula]|uniref:Zinc finger, C3HC4 type (RING finger) protein n=2 Tax=Medicago truncatula TaxID=3880 RepID=G7J8R9_MEDTR|nr:E3 ubiquitin-protein ligase bre1 [Medicago truncatula]AES70946.1 zinc finger, C3HC4 type (RING finger) protein [Medicago truncatula]